MPKVICKKLGCNKLVEKGINNGYCDDHKEAGVKLKQEANKIRYAEYDKTRDKKLVNFYNNAKWKHSTREYILTRDNYLCQDCIKTNRHISSNLEVHHIVEVKEDWNKRYDEDNLITLCKSCHRKRHSKYKRGE